LHTGMERMRLSPRFEVLVFGAAAVLLLGFLDLRIGPNTRALPSMRARLVANPLVVRPARWMREVP
jgi:hypothetical protein